jgi:hypothetical protein
MKKTVLLLAVAFSAVIGNAQSFKKADKFLEGTISYTKSTGIDAEHSINPTVGYWMTDRFAVGATAELSKSAAKTTGVGVFGRCQFLTVSKNINVFSQLSLSSTTEDVAGVKTTTFNTGLNLGAYSFVTKRLAITMSLADLVSYTSVDSKSTFTLGFSGVNNPFSTAKFGVAYKF